MSPTIRSYQPSDRAAVLAVFKSNVPDFFAAGEERDLMATLDEPDGPSWVVELDGKVIGFGGYEVGELYNRATLTWGMVDRRFHKNGIGRSLLDYRMTHAAGAAPETRWLVVDTTPQVAGFFERCGFERVEEWAKGYRSGFDMVVLRADLESFRAARA